MYIIFLNFHKNLNFFLVFQSVVYKIIFEQYIYHVVVNLGFSYDFIISFKKLNLYDFSFQNYFMFQYRSMFLLPILTIL